MLSLLLPMAVAPVAFAQAAVNSPAAAIEQAQAQTGQNGKVLGVREKTDADGSAYYEVKILDGGKVQIIKIARQ